MREAVVVMKIVCGTHPVRPKELIPFQNEQADLFWSLLVSCWAYNPQDRPTATHVRDEVSVDTLGQTFYLTNSQMACITPRVS